MNLGTQLATLLSVVIGGAVSFVGATLSERSRWKRDLGRQWTQHRFDACRELIHIVHVQVGAARSLATTRNLLEGPPPVSVEDGVREIAESDRQLALAYETVQMLCDERTGEAARVWRSTVWQLSDYARGVIEGDSEQWEVAYTHYRVAREAFHGAIRQDLGIPGRGYQRHTFGPSSRPPGLGPTT